MLNATPVPIAAWPYLDKIQFWLRKPIGNPEISSLRQQCGRGGVHAEGRAARFDARFRQRVELRQPSAEALQWLAMRRDALINRAEIALDLIFGDRNKRDDVFEFLHYRLVRRWHGKRQNVKLVRGVKHPRKRRRVPEIVEEVGFGHTRYDAPRSAPNGIAFYHQPFSRLTGELDCLHLEWRLNGLRAVRNAGISSGRDLIQFDHRSFWNERLLLYEVDEARLGRLIGNHRSGERRRVDRPLDGKIGHVLFSSVGTIQELIDEYGASLRLHRALERIPIEAFLPCSEQ